MKAASSPQRNATRPETSSAQRIVGWPAAARQRAPLPPASAPWLLYGDAREDGVHRDAIVADLVREAAGEADDPRLGRHVMAHSLRIGADGVRGDVDESAPSPLPHRRDEVLGAQ